MLIPGEKTYQYTIVTTDSIDTIELQ